MTVDRNTKQQGNAAEQRAYEYLKAKGLKLLERNYYCACGEIDLIMQDGEAIVFIEVRSRSKNNIADVLESVDIYKQIKLIKTATYYLKQKHLFDRVDCRFDVIGIHPTQLEWIKNAFTADNL